MNPFFVTGLPRSRTAWVANWLTTDMTICFHDVEPETSKFLLNKRVGFAGPELIWKMRELERSFPSAPWLFLMRDPDECLASWKKAAGKVLPHSHPDFALLWKKRVEILEDSDGLPLHSLVISYEELDEEPVARAVWQHLIGTPFDLDRWKMLTEFNIQQKFEQVLKDRTKGTQWASLAQ